VAERAYAPYSRYLVGAAVLARDGRVVEGVNVENAAYPLGSCAEAGAIAAMVFGGERQIVEVVTVTEGDRPGTPCGGCRQRLREFAALSVPVYATTADGGVLALTVEQLLPESFGPEFLDPHPI
jgi:cytidine deaminase